MKNKMEMTLEENEIKVAHRIGEKRRGKPRPMVVKCKPGLRQRVFQFTKNLKGKTNANDKGFFIDP